MVSEYFPETRQLISKKVSFNHIDKEILQ